MTGWLIILPWWLMGMGAHGSKAVPLCLGGVKQRKGGPQAVKHSVTSQQNHPRTLGLWGHPISKLYGTALKFSVCGGHTFCVPFLNSSGWFSVLGPRLRRTVIVAGPLVEWEIRIAVL